jgi:hypothetical protein
MPIPPTLNTLVLRVLTTKAVEPSLECWEEDPNLENDVV